jgi:hypothetical protein
MRVRRKRCPTSLPVRGSDLEEAIVAAVDSDAIAEVIAGRLRSEGLAVRVRYDSQAGIPRQLQPAGLGFGPGAFRVAVAVRDAERAREILGDEAPEPYRRRPVLRVIATILLIVALLSLIPGVTLLVQVLFGLDR